jgi:hypothetical protein
MSYGTYLGEQCGYFDEREARIRALEARVAADMVTICLDGGDVIEDEHGKRGMARAVVRDDGEEYPTVSAAARRLGDGVKPDWVCQAIKRDGRCKSHRFAYIGQVPSGFYDLPEGSACPFPYEMGNPILVIDPAQG